MIAALTWLTGSRIGQYVAIVAFAVVSIGLVIWRVFVAGKTSAENAAKIESIQESVNAFAKRVTTDNDLGRMSAADRRQRLQQHWTIAE